ncbi:hypothetical protein BQ1740_2208 [Bacillus subtilis]|nr:hypothetical protein BQ1740_2208 [Bacillus subtilis]
MIQCDPLLFFKIKKAVSNVMKRLNKNKQSPMYSVFSPLPSAGMIQIRSKGLRQSLSQLRKAPLG